jgi:MoxR-like ATPase
MPSDIIGSSVFARDRNQFVFMPGPLFTTVLVADELNRGTPRTQAALLQAMAEGQCTSDNKTYQLSPNFFVIATQNPIEHQGTFPLPEAQLDRFMMRISVGYPDLAIERQIVRSQLLQHPIENLAAVATEEEWSKVRQAVRHIEVSEECLAYATQVVHATRNHPQLIMGASPRASIALIRAAQAFAFLFGDGYVKPDRVKQVAPAILDHRVMIAPRARVDKVSGTGVIAEILGRIPVPIRRASAAQPAAMGGAKSHCNF